MWICWCKSTGDHSSKLKEGDLELTLKEVLYSVGGEAVGPVALKSLDTPFLGTFRARLDGAFPGQPVLVDGSPACSRGLEKWVVCLVCSNQTIL